MAKETPAKVAGGNTQEKDTSLPETLLCSECSEHKAKRKSTALSHV